MKRNSSERGAALVGMSVFLLAVAGLLYVAFFTFGKVVPPNSIGIRHNGFSVFGVLEKGYSPNGLQPGLHWRVPWGVSDIILVPRTFQFINFNNINKGADLNLRELDVPTSDGSKVKTDITMVMRLLEQPGKAKFSVGAVDDGAADDPSNVPLVSYQEREHGGPQNLVSTYTDQPLQQLKLFSRGAEDYLRQDLGQLSTTDYYNPSRRERAALRAHDSISKAVAPNGVELWATLIRRYVYAERDIDDQIFAKNLQEQQERLNAASTKLAEVQAITERETAEWDAKIKSLEVEGRAQVQVIRSEGELYESKKRADGDLLVAKAAAEVDQAKANALNEIEGADIYVAREMASILGTLKGGVVSDLDPFNINDWVNKLTDTSSKATR